MRRRDEIGSTLVETIVVVVIVGIVGAAILTVLLLFVRSQQPTTSRIADAGDLSNLQAYWENDLSSAVGADVSPTSQLIDGTIGTNILTTWTSADPAQATYVSYRYVESGATASIVRYVAKPDGTPARTPVVNDVAPTGVGNAAAVSATSNPVSAKLTVTMSSGRTAMVAGTSLSNGQTIDASPVATAAPKPAVTSPNRYTPGTSGACNVRTITLSPGPAPFPNRFSVLNYYGTIAVLYSPILPAGAVPTGWSSPDLDARVRKYFPVTSESPKTTNGISWVMTSYAAQGTTQAMTDAFAASGPLRYTIFFKRADGTLGQQDDCVTYTSIYYQEGTPIALDLNGDGHIGVTGTGTGTNTHRTIGTTVQFDLDADGTTETIEWFNGDGDGILVDNRNGNANHHLTGAQLFGDQGGRYRDGYAKLARLDTNHDGAITGPELTGLVIWVDNGNARFDTGEFHALTEYGITSLSTQVTHVGDMLRSTATTTDGTMMTEDVILKTAH